MEIIYHKDILEQISDAVFGKPSNKRIKQIELTKDEYREFRQSEYCKENYREYELDNETYDLKYENIPVVLSWKE